MKASYINVVASISKQHGGPSYSVTGLCDALAISGQNVILVAQKTIKELDSDLVLPRNSNVVKILFNSFRKFRITYTLGYKNKLSKIVANNQHSIIHNHGLWLQCNHQSAIIAREYNIPYIISPRGMMEPWAFAYNAWKKKIAWRLWQKQALENATAFCATSFQEAESIRKLGFCQPIAIIPNGVDLLSDPPKKSANIATRYALFLSRIHPKKGLLNLVDAWSQIQPMGWKVIIAGPDENGHQNEVQQKIDAYELSDFFEFVGSVEGELKKQLYRDASLFILPTFSENFGIVVAESLACGTPVITTKGAPWQGLLTNNCGWWIDVGVDPLAEAIKHATSLSDIELLEMGQRGRDYVAREFGWDDIGKKMVKFYEWIIYGGVAPYFVKLD